MKIKWKYLAVQYSVSLSSNVAWVKFITHHGTHVNTYSLIVILLCYFQSCSTLIQINSATNASHVCSLFLYSKKLLCLFFSVCLQDTFSYTNNNINNKLLISKTKILCIDKIKEPQPCSNVQFLRLLYTLQQLLCTSLSLIYRTRS